MRAKILICILVQISVCYPCFADPITRLIDADARGADTEMGIVAIQRFPDNETGLVVIEITVEPKDESQEVLLSDAKYRLSLSSPEEEKLECFLAAKEIKDHARIVFTVSERLEKFAEVNIEYVDASGNDVWLMIRLGERDLEGQ